jgi:hypothetical protein
VKFLKVALLVFLAALAGTYLPVSAADDLRPELKINREKGDQCVEPTDVMRKNHMKFLLHQRDETMHNGIRTKKHSLKECVECHANKDETGKYLPVNAPGEFCYSCHAYSSVKLDCFECHATKPRQNTAFHPIVTPGMKKFRDVHDNRALINSMSDNN